MQLRELLLKYWRVYWRTPSYTLARCFLTLCVAFIYGSMYYRAAVLPKPYASMGNIQNIMGIMFSSTSFLGMTNLMAVMPLVGKPRSPPVGSARSLWAAQHCWLLTWHECANRGAGQRSE